MVTPLYLGVILAAVCATTASNADINVICTKDSVKINWRINAELVPTAARLFLGNCMASRFTVLPNGEGEAEFNYKFDDCKFKKMLKGKRVLFRNELTYRPQAKSKPAAFVYPIECVFQRPPGWASPFITPGSGLSEGRGGLVFHMALLDEQLKGIAKTNVIQLGNFMPIWAAVEQKSHQPLLLLIDECLATTTPELLPDSQVYPIITNKGCLVESMVGKSTFLPRYHSSSLTLYLQSFKFGLGQEIYIHCKLVAWDPNVLDESKKACQYVKEDMRWELLDDPSRSSICSCCDSTCRSRSRRGVDTDSQGFSYNSVLGPLLIVDQSDSNADNLSKESLL